MEKWLNVGQCIFASSFQFSCDFLDALLVPHSTSPALREGRAKCSFANLLGWQGDSSGSVQVCGAPVGAEGSLCPAQGTAGTDAQRLPCSVLQQA